MEIDVTYESDVASAPTGFKACVNAACQDLDALQTDFTHHGLHLPDPAATLSGRI